MVAVNQLSTLLLTLALGASPEGEYAARRIAAMQNGRPLIVLVGANWCSACPAAKQLAGELKRKGEYVYLDLDRQGALISNVAPGTVLPRLAVWSRQKPDGTWSRVLYVGVDQIRSYALDK